MAEFFSKIVSMATTVITDISSHVPANATVPISKELYAKNGRMLIAAILMILGVLGNFWALLILARKKATKNSKYTLMLRCLASNNLIGLLGMITTLMLQVYVAKEVFRRYIYIDCVMKVVWRFFGLSSGCIAAVMAIERWMALARPFIYHKHITYELIRKSINSLVLIATVITFLPFVGFGAYYEVENDEIKCVRYRDAEGFLNKMYSVLFMLFGSLLCVVIVVCNLFVTRVLCFIGRTRTTKRHMHYDLVNREKGIRIDSDSNSAGSSLFGHHQQQASQYHHSNSVKMTADASPDEIKFAKLMAFLSISFVLCWMPQMIAIPMAIIPQRVPKDHPFFIAADILMALHFTSDPYVYVLSRSKQTSMFSCFKRYNGGIKRSQSVQSRRTITVENTIDCSLLCVVIVVCNLFVTRVLCFIGRTRTTKRHMHYDLVNREKGIRIDSDSNSAGSSLFGHHQQQASQYHHSNSVKMTADASPDEIKFAKLMAFLSISFVLCWMPQMIAIPMAIIPQRVPKDHPFFIAADILMALHFTSDPYVYVLSRSKQTSMFSCFKRYNGGIKRSQSVQSRRTITVENTIDCSLLCVVIVVCNLFVTRVLCFIGRTRTTKRHMHYDLVNREKGIRIDSDSNSAGSSLFGHHQQQASQYHHSNSVKMTADASPDEIKFAKLMAFLSISFVLCWMPQMIAIPMAIIPQRVPKDHPFFIAAGILMALHFTSDPYVYVLSRSKQTSMFSCFKRYNGGIKRSQSVQSRRTITVENTIDCNFN